MHLARPVSTGLVCALLGLGMGCSSSASDDASDASELSAKHCGNGVCNRNETCSSCPADCGQGPTTYAGASGSDSGSSDPDAGTATATPSGVGPQASITCAAGAVSISPG